MAILDAGRATLELSNPAQMSMIDQVETGASGSPPFRLAFEVADTRGVTRRLTAAGAPLLGGPTVTPWRSLNARLDSPAGVQVTLFEELLPLAERETLREFGTDSARRTTENG